MKWHLLPLFGFALLCGCVNNSMVTIGENFEETDRSQWVDEDYFAHSEFAALETSLRRRLENCAVVDRPLLRLQLASVLLQENKKKEAHKALFTTSEELETLFDPTAEARALSLWHGEQEKVYKGDGWERATLYAFLGLSFLDSGDWEKAIKCAKNGILCDSDSEKREYVADYALLPYIGYLAAVRGGKEDEARKFALQFKAIVGYDIPEAAKGPNALLVCWAGRGASYALGGEFEEKRYVVPGSDFGLLDAVSVSSGGSTEMFSLSGLADLNFQATTRGGRLMDNVLKDKAMVKRGFAVSANVLLVMAAGLFEAGSESLPQMAIFYPPAGVLALLGGSSYVVGKAVTPKADGRIWGCVPGRLLVVPLSEKGHFQLTLNGYRGWDQTLRRKIDVDVSGPGLPVCHVSLQPFRREMEERWRKAVYSSGLDAANRSQLQRSEKLHELTEEREGR